MEALMQVLKNSVSHLPQLRKEAEAFIVGAIELPEAGDIILKLSEIFKKCSTRCRYSCSSWFSFKKLLFCSRSGRSKAQEYVMVATATANSSRCEE